MTPSTQSQGPRAVVKIEAKAIPAQSSKKPSMGKERQVKINLPNLVYMHGCRGTRFLIWVNK